MELTSMSSSPETSRRNSETWTLVAPTVELESEPTLVVVATPALCPPMVIELLANEPDGVGVPAEETSSK